MTSVGANIRQEPDYLPPEHELHTFGPFRAVEAIVEDSEGPTNIPEYGSSFALVDAVDNYLPFSCDRKVEVNNIDMICSAVADAEAVSTVRLLWVADGQTIAAAKSAGQYLTGIVSVVSGVTLDTWTAIPVTYANSVLPAGARIALIYTNATGDTLLRGLLIRLRTHTTIR